MGKDWHRALSIRMRRLNGLTVVLLAFASAGCTDEDSNLILVKDNVFEPSAKAVAKDTNLTFENQGARVHSVTVHRGGEPVTTLRRDIDLSPGDSTYVFFATPGTYHVYCKYHSDGGQGDFDERMVLTVTVA